MARLLPDPGSTPLSNLIWHSKLQSQLNSFQLFRKLDLLPPGFCTSCYLYPEYPIWLIPSLLPGFNRENWAVFKDSDSGLRRALYLI